MTENYTDAFRDSKLSKGIIKQIKESSHKNIRLMEVCGTHTVSIFRSGIRDVLPETISLLSGPGCPVCVTSQGEIDAFIELSKQDDTIITTFGDLIRVPGSGSSLREQSGKGKDIRIIYSPSDALKIAAENPDKKVVFLGVGFETTTPTIAATIMAAEKSNLHNFSVCPAHKVVMPALNALMETEGVKIDGFILPGHVSAVLGSDAYRPFVEKYKIPAVVAGFEPADILHGVSMLVEQIESGRAEAENAYKRMVTPEGNLKAMEIMMEVFEICDATWRGIGMIPESGLRIREKYQKFDALKVFNLEITENTQKSGCSCGEILTGLKIPPECKLYKKACTPENPYGPCMVSSEGTCAAYFRYYR